MENSFMELESQLPRYYPLPQFILQLKISSTSKILYALLLNRTNLSQKNGWKDDDGYVFVVYPLEELARDMNKGQTAIKDALKELKEQELLESVRPEYGRANHIYVKVPQEADRVGKPPVIWSENQPSVSRKAAPDKAGKPPANNYTKSPYNNNQRDIRLVDYSYQEGESL